MEPGDWPPARLVELDRGECLEVLGQHRVGRVVWAAGGRAHVALVNYRLLGEEIWWRTAPYTQLATQIAAGASSRSGQDLVFEVDEIDDVTQSGVSVVVAGRAHREDHAPAGAELPTWVEGQRTFVVRVVADQVSGRRLLPT